MHTYTQNTVRTEKKCRELTWMCIQYIGLDRTKPNRLDHQEALVVMGACVGQMDIVIKLKERTNAITEELDGLTNALRRCVKELRTTLESMLHILEPSARAAHMPAGNNAFELTEKKIKKRPHTAESSGHSTQDEGIQIADADFESPHFCFSPNQSHVAVLGRSTLKLPHNISGLDLSAPKIKDQNGVLPEGSYAKNDHSSSHCSIQNRSFRKSLSGVVESSDPEAESSAIWKEAETVMKKLQLASLPLDLLKESQRGIVENVDRIQNDDHIGTMNSDEEDELYEEIERISHAQERAIEMDIDWEYESARLWNSAAMQVVMIEQAYEILFQILTPPALRDKYPDPEIPLEHIALALVKLGVKSDNIDLDCILEESQKGVNHLGWVVPEGHYNWKGKGVRFSALIAASKSFRKAILHLNVSEPLCRFTSSKVSNIFSAAQARSLVEGCKIVQKWPGDIIFDQIQNPRPRLWSLLLDGEIQISKMEGDLEKEVHFTRNEGLVFGAFAALQNHISRLPGRKTTDITLTTSNPLKEGIVLRAKTKCLLLQMTTDALQDVCMQMCDFHDFSNVSLLRNEMLECHNRDFSTIRTPDFENLERLDDELDSMLPELQRKKLCDSFALLNNVWDSISVGANTVHKGALDIMKRVLGEAGVSACEDVFKPMYTEQAPIEFRTETFWYCWTLFLSQNWVVELRPQSADLEETTEGPINKKLLQDTSVHSSDFKMTDLVMEQEFAIFEEQETIQERIIAWVYWKDRRITPLFLETSPNLLEQEFLRVAGSRNESLQGEKIRKYLTHVMVEHPYAISLDNCHEFCKLFDKKFDKTTKIAYQEIVKLVSPRERNKNSITSNSTRPIIGSTINPDFILMRAFIFVMRLVALYHFVMVPVRIAFMPFTSFTSQEALRMDLPADLVVVLHWIVSINTAYKSEVGTWISSRAKILRESDLLLLLAVLPLDWFGYACGLSHEPSLWLRLNKMVLFFSRVSPKVLLFSGSDKASSKVLDLMLMIAFTMHICACCWYYIGRFPTGSKLR